MIQKEGTKLDHYYYLLPPSYPTTSAALARMKTILKLAFIFLSITQMKFPDHICQTDRQTEIETLGKVLKTFSVVVLTTVCYSVTKHRHTRTHVCTIMFGGTFTLTSIHL